jgi:hypothetical protein
MGFETLSSFGNGKGPGEQSGMSRRDFFKKFIPQSEPEDPQAREGDAHPEEARTEEKVPRLWSRRDFLKVAAVGAVGTYVMGPGIRNEVESRVSAERLSKEIAEIRNRIWERYGIDVRIEEPKQEETSVSKTSEAVRKDTTGQTTDTTDVHVPRTPNPFIDSTRVAQLSQTEDEYSYAVKFLENLSERKRAIELLEQELVFFPTGIVRRSRLKGVFLLEGLQQVTDHGTRELPGAEGGAVVEVLDGEGTTIRTLLLAVSGNDFNRNNEFGWSEGDNRVNVRHEMLHALDEISDEDWMRAVGRHADDEARTALRYAGNAEERRQVSEVDLQSLPVKGFARSYGRTNPREDRATVFEMITKASSEKLHDRVDDDTALSRKISVVAAYVMRKSSGLMNGRYWKVARGGDRMPEGFFGREAERILSTSYDNFVADSDNFEIEGIRIPGVPQQDEYAMWQEHLRTDYPKSAAHVTG